MSTRIRLDGATAARAPARVPSRGRTNVRAVFRGERSSARRVTARAGADEEGRTTSAETKSNLIAYEPAPDAPEPWWPVDERTGKPPGWFQLLVFAASQVFIGLAEPFIAKTPLQ
jgi:hypothetical protein